ncbi:MAG: glycosyltransferase [Opitutaceae bacterium]|nr:glycosyltransferase [Opitutaceae bacterium]
MRIVHFTNTFLPHVGGVAHAVRTLLEGQRSRRHRVLVVAPEFSAGAAPKSIERSVVRIPAFTNFNDSEFSVRIPFAATLSDRLSTFKTDIIHAHHPFLLGDTALREAASRQVPILFTHHTLYENYTHYLPIQSEAAAEFAADVATRFANRCTAVVAPSESVRDLIASRGVTVPIHVIPTGIDSTKFSHGDRIRGRKRWSIGEKAIVIGHVGRLAAEKNLGFLADSLSLTLRDLAEARVLIVGDGPAKEEMVTRFNELGVADRVVFTGKLTGQALRDASASMDLFAFSSFSETQGLVLAEAMAAGLPVVALDAPGAREVVRDRENGRLLPGDASPAQLSDAIGEALRAPKMRLEWAAAARVTAQSFDIKHTNARMLELYAELVRIRKEELAGQSPVERALKPAVERIATEGRILADKAGALLSAIATPSNQETNDAPAPAGPAAA